jgi:hypothetical protein
MSKPKAIYTMQAKVIRTGEIHEWVAHDEPDYICFQQDRYKASDLHDVHIKGTSRTRRAALEEGE